MMDNDPEVAATPEADAVNDTAGSAVTGAAVNGVRLEHWFSQLCRMLPNPGAGVIVELDSGRPGQVLLKSPPGEQTPPGLNDAVDKVAESRTPFKGGDVLAQPLHRNGDVFAVVAIGLEVSGPQQDVVLHLMKWADGWLELLLNSGTALPVETANAASSEISELQQLLLDTAHLQAALLALADSLAVRFESQRVAIGMRHGNQLRLKALSHGLQFDHRTRLAGELEAALSAATQKQVLRWSVLDPGKDADLASLARFTGNNQVLACALGDNAAIVFERSGDEPFTDAERDRAAAIGSTLGPLLNLRCDQVALFPPRVRRGISDLLDRVIKPGHRGFKLGLAAVVLVSLFLGVVQGNYRVSAQADIEGLVQRAVVAPFDGFIAEANFRAGDTVASGDVIARMEDRELLLELRKSTSEEEKLDNEYRRALASADRSEALAAQARLAQVQAQSRLLEEQIKRVELSAPIDGIIISGDLRSALGAPVGRGDVLFEVAPADEYRLVLEIEETDIAQVQAGQQGLLTLTALPDQPIQFVIQRVSPVFLEQEGKVVYRTEARIEGDASRLRPGMAGVGKVEVGERRYGWILFHRLSDWLRLKLWQWLP